MLAVLAADAVVELGDEEEGEEELTGSGDEAALGVGAWELELCELELGELEPLPWLD